MQVKICVVVFGGLSTFFLIVGVHNILSKKYIFYKLLQHKVVIIFVHRPPKKFPLLGCVTPSFIPNEAFDPIFLMLLLLALSGGIVGLSIFAWQRHKYHLLRWAQFGGALGALLAAGTQSSDVNFAIPEIHAAWEEPVTNLQVLSCLSQRTCNGYLSCNSYCFPIVRCLKIHLSLLSEGPSASCNRHQTILWRAGSTCIH